VLAALDGDKEKLVIDLSCRRKDDTWFVAMNKWQTITDMEVNEGLYFQSCYGSLANTYQRPSNLSSLIVPNF
jgi:hypothetical protein